MITKEAFVEYISHYKDFDAAIDRIEYALSGKPFKCELFESDWYDLVYKMLKTFLNTYFTKLGIETIEWWLWEDVDKVIYETVEPDLFNGEKEIEINVEKLEDLWDYLNSHKEDYIKNE